MDRPSRVDSSLCLQLITEHLKSKINVAFARACARIRSGLAAAPSKRARTSVRSACASAGSRIKKRATTDHAAAKAKKGIQAMEDQAPQL